MHYFVEILVRKGNRMTMRYVVDAIDSQAELGGDIMRLVIGHGCLVQVRNYDYIPECEVIEPGEFYESAVANL
jgi:hypothetical protein